MEFKKCARCGSFFMSNNNVCCNCESKDKLDMANLNSVLGESPEITSVESLSDITGISTNNLNRFIQENIIPNFNQNL